MTTPEIQPYQLIYEMISKLESERIYDLNRGQMFVHGYELFTLHQTVDDLGLTDLTNDKIPCTRVGFIKEDGQIHYCTEQYDNEFHVDTQVHILQFKLGE